jgi:soluble lytic murein transglycosylase-like protein
MGSLMVLFTTTSLQLGLPANLLSSICFVETRHNTNAIHYNDGGEDSIGICQIHLSTARHMGFKGTAQELLNPKTNIWYAGLYLKHQIKRYRNAYNRAIIAYNRGNARGLTATNYSDKVFKTWRNNDYAAN